MNKKELIKKIEALPAENYKYSPWIDKKLVLGLVKQLDEPEKVKVPPFVSVWYRISKDNLYKNIAYLCANWVKSTTTDNVLFNWMSNTDNFIEILINMHQFGYEVEKEPKYIVKLKNGQPLVKAPLGKNFYFNQNITAGNYKATRKELEEAGFGWVFSCEGIEIEEVE